MKIEETKFTGYSIGVPMRNPRKPCKKCRKMIPRHAMKRHLVAHLKNDNRSKPC